MTFELPQHCLKSFFFFFFFFFFLSCKKLVKTTAVCDLRIYVYFFIKPVLNALKILWDLNSLWELPSRWAKFFEISQCEIWHVCCHSIGDSLICFLGKRRKISWICHLLNLPREYHIYCLFWDRQVWAKSVDPDETLQNAVSHQSLQCLPLIQQFLETSGSKLYLFRF